MSRARDRFLGALEAAKSPGVRAQERDALLTELAAAPSHVVLEVAAWYGYVADAIPDPSRLVLVESLGLFAEHLRKRFPRVLESTQGVEAGSVDRVCTLVGLHHIDAAAFAKEARRILKPGGRVAIAEVADGSVPAKFLNGPVSELTSPLGHHGKFFGAGDLGALLRSAGFVNVEERNTSTAWHFDSMEHAVAYCRGLFGLVGADESVRAAIATLEPETSESGIAVPWPLVIASGDVAP